VFRGPIASPPPLGSGSGRFQPALVTRA
jgi:hypothetical protein